MPQELNNVLGLSVDWTRLKKKDLEQIYRAITDLTLFRALALHRESLRRKVETMPILTLIRDSVQALQKSIRLKGKPYLMTLRPQGGIIFL